MPIRSGLMCAVVVALCVVGVGCVQLSPCGGITCSAGRSCEPTTGQCVFDNPPVDSGIDAGPVDTDSGVDAGSVDSGLVDAGFDAGTMTVDAGRDAGTTAVDAGPVLPRLFATSALDGGRLLVWNHVNAIAADLGPSFAIKTVGTGSALALDDSDRLVVGYPSGPAALQLYDGSMTLSAGATPALQLATSTTFGAVSQLHFDNAGRLWLLYGAGRVAMFASAIHSNADTTTAVFTHVNDQLQTFAYDDVADRLFAGQVSGAGILAWNDASLEVGDAGVNDFQLSPDNAGRCAVADDRLYTAFFTPSVKIWDSFSGLGGPNAADVTLNNAALVNVRSIFLRDDALVLTGYTAGTPSVGKVNIFLNASMLNASRAPDFQITHSSLSQAESSVLGADGTLYVRDEDGISVFRNALNSPTFVVELKLGVLTPGDLLLVE